MNIYAKYDHFILNYTMYTAIRLVIWLESYECSYMRLFREGFSLVPYVNFSKDVKIQVYHFFDNYYTSKGKFVENLDLLYKFTRSTNHTKHNENYIDILGPPNDCYHQ
jgi:hypothetical protein